MYLYIVNLPTTEDIDFSKDMLDNRHTRYWLSYWWCPCWLQAAAGESRVSLGSALSWSSPDRTQLVQAGLATFAARHQTSVQGENKEAAAPCLATVTAWKYWDEEE